ncbi:poly(A) polymerase-like [Macrobrachium rosenbergii]|uniref:poly(A) polymerase-like n=1 Tax=Macrobrachium rosenbergii TaxID=79674 RepID=UPI0034D3DBD7
MDESTDTDTDTDIQSQTNDGFTLVMKRKTLRKAGETDRQKNNHRQTKSLKMNTPTPVPQIQTDPKGEPDIICRSSSLGKEASGNTDSGTTKPQRTLKTRHQQLYTSDTTKRKNKAKCFNCGQGHHVWYKGLPNTAPDNLENERTNSNATTPATTTPATTTPATTTPPTTTTTTTTPPTTAPATTTSQTTTSATTTPTTIIPATTTSPTIPTASPSYKTSTATHTQWADTTEQPQQQTAPTHQPKQHRQQHKTLSPPPP